MGLPFQIMLVLCTCITVCVSITKTETTFVTALFDCGRYSTWTGNLAVHRTADSLGQVLQCAKGGVLSVPAPLVVFAQPELVPSVVQLRSEALHAINVTEGTRRMASTKVVPTRMDDLPMAAHVEKIREIMRAEASHDDQTRHGTPAALSPCYAAVVHSKPFLMATVADANPFETSLFAWVDFTTPSFIFEPFKPLYSHRGHLVPEKTLYREGKVHLVKRWNYVQDVQLKDIYRDYAGAASTSFMLGERDAVMRMAHVYDSVLLDDMLSHNVLDNDKTAIVLALQHDHTLFRTTVGDHGDGFALFYTWMENGNGEYELHSTG